jgi:precorrin-8X/cobalt-precorrin-8 methylmutase
VIVHPIEAESYRILAERVDLSGFGPLARAVASRMIHASADPEYAETLVTTEEHLASGITALRRGAAVVTDVEMVRHGIPGVDARCYLNEVEGQPARSGRTRSAAAMGLAAARHPQGAVFVVGCAPTALEELVRLHATRELEPALVVGVPVGFVGAAAAKEALRASGLPAISNVGEKGGSAVAAAAVNALLRLARS